MKKPLCIDLFCGVGGFTEGALLEGYDCIGFDIEQHVYGQHRYPAQLVVQDILTLHGSQFRSADLIWASPPCQAYSWMAMPWKLAKAKAAAIRADTTGQALADLNRLFDACFRIQKEASIAAGRHIPMVVENVRGAIPWVGRSRWNFGSFHLWGDVPALMPMTIRAQKFNPDGTNHPSGSWFAIADSKNRGAKNTGGSWSNIAHNTTSGKGNNPDGRKVPSSDGGRRTDPGKGARFTSRDCGIEASGLKRPGIKLSEVGFNVSMARDVAAGLKGAKYERTAEDKRQHIGINRKAASAMIAKIPGPLSRHIAKTFHPQTRKIV